MGYEITVKNSKDNRREEEEMDEREEEEKGRRHTYAEMLVLSKQCQAQKVSELYIISWWYVGCKEPSPSMDLFDLGSTRVRHCLSSSSI